MYNPVMTSRNCKIDLLSIKCTSFRIIIKYHYMFIIPRVYNPVVSNRIYNIEIVSIKPAYVPMIRPDPKLLKCYHHNVL